jgi:hypothetical protein
MLAVRKDQLYKVTCFTGLGTSPHVTQVADHNGHSWYEFHSTFYKARKLINIGDYIVEFEGKISVCSKSRFHELFMVIQDSTC